MFESKPKPSPKAKPAPPRNPEAVLRRLEWTVLRRLDGLLHGDYRTLFRGFGLDLADIREYQYGDDVRHIDWNVTARLQTPYVREYHEDREITAWFLLDLSRSVDFGSRDVQKRAVAADFTAMLARMLTRHGNRVGAIFYGLDVDQVIRPGSGRRQVLAILHALEQRKPLPEGKGTQLDVLLKSAFNFIHRRSLLFIVSDFISAPGWDRPLMQLAQRHETVAVRLYDPLEIELPDLGLLVFQDAETGEQLFVDTHDGRFRQRFMDAAERREAAVRSALANSGVDALELSTDADLVDTVMRFADLRKRKRAVNQAAVPA
ncbi:MAG TPA: DUF58 domain-containing protein [Burkholderiales bacterium]|jgi:uncharacterized protein (DUF58 family)|nr:DUF58 domain-containing protein [Burkholderiales bacterium]